MRPGENQGEMAEEEEKKKKRNQSVPQSSFGVNVPFPGLVQLGRSKNK